MLGSIDKQGPSFSDIVGESQTSKTGGRKFDGGKPRFGLIPTNALLEVVNVLTYGAQKYDDENWRKVPNAIDRYFDAMQRHAWAWKQGEENDNETGLSHLSHAICCAMFIIELSKKIDK